MKTIKDLCEQYNMGQTALARRFGIPLRTVQAWHAGDRVPPDYVVNMIEELLAWDKWVAEMEELDKTQDDQRG